MYIKSLGSKLNITLFLGAGASVQFGNPATKTFKEQLIEKNMFDEQFLPLLKLKSFPDIEYVLQCLKEIRELGNNQLGKFLYNNEFVFEMKSLIQNETLPQSTTKFFINSVEVYYNQIMIYLFETYKIAEKEESKLKKFFDGLFGIIYPYSNRIDVGTTNYDLSVETFCNLGGSDYHIIDGFEFIDNHYNWNQKVFDKTDEKIKYVYLHKIHGSLNWVGRDSNIIKHAKIPNFLPIGSNQEYNAIIAPTLSPKDAYEKEPFSSLLKFYSEKLLNSDVCIVIGFSFRDDDITKYFKEFVDKGKHLIIISPSCRSDYVKNLFKLRVDGNDTEINGYANAHAISNERHVDFIDSSCDEENNKEIFKKIESALK